MDERFLIYIVEYMQKDEVVVQTPDLGTFEKWAFRFWLKGYDEEDVSKPDNFFFPSR
jgi:predicted double-glycine peptidase